jgi:hypothetical protein
MPSIYIINPASTVPGYHTADAFADAQGNWTQVADLTVVTVARGDREAPMVSNVLRQASQKPLALAAVLHVLVRQARYVLDRASASAEMLSA